MYLEASGDGVVTAGQIQETADYEIVNPELHLATLESPDARLSVEFTVEPRQRLRAGRYQRRPRRLV